MFSPAAKAGLTVGDTIVTINDWNVEAMENIQVNIVHCMDLRWSVSDGLCAGRPQHIPGCGFLCGSGLEQVCWWSNGPGLA